MKERILLVEDDERLASITAEYLTKNNFDVKIEGRGNPAEERIVREAPDLVILDVMLPAKMALKFAKPCVINTPASF